MILSGFGIYVIFSVNYSKEITLSGFHICENFSDEEKLANSPLIDCQAVASDFEYGT